MQTLALLANGSKTETKSFITSILSVNVIKHFLFSVGDTQDKYILVKHFKPWLIFEGKWAGSTID